MKLWTVGELNVYLKDKLENDHVLANLWVTGEISNYKRASSGHMYFTLKDAQSCVKAVMFSSRARSLLFQPENGAAVRVRGYVSLYERDGIYQLYVQEMEPDGLGALYMAFEQLKKKLANEGLFDQERKQRLPLFPSCIGIVTSPTGAVIRDMLNIIGRRWPGIRLLLHPVAVQGEAAPGEIAAAIEKLNQWDGVDIIIVGRGGGSLEELWAFNTETVARAIAASHIPVVSAVGHETDFTIADMVADLRAPTPSAAAELVVFVKDEVRKNLLLMQDRLQHSLREYLERCRIRLNNAKESVVFRRPEDKIFAVPKMQLDFLVHRLEEAGKRELNKRQDGLTALVDKLQVLSPLSILTRGYAICQQETTGQVMKNSRDALPGERVRVTLQQGQLLCLVEKSEEKMRIG